MNGEQPASRGRGTGCRRRRTGGAVAAARPARSLGRRATWRHAAGARRAAGVAHRRRPGDLSRHDPRAAGAGRGAGPGQFPTATGRASGDDGGRGDGRGDPGGAPYAGRRRDRRTTARRRLRAPGQFRTDRRALPLGGRRGRHRGDPAGVGAGGGAARVGPLLRRTARSRRRRGADRDRPGRRLAPTAGAAGRGRSAARRAQTAGNPRHRRGEPASRGGPVAGPVGRTAPGRGVAGASRGAGRPGAGGGGRRGRFRAPARPDRGARRGERPLLAPARRPPTASNGACRWRTSCGSIRPTGSARPAGCGCTCRAGASS